MDPGVTPWHSTPRGRPPAGIVPWRGRYLHRPIPVFNHSDSNYYQTADPRREYPHWPGDWGEVRQQRQPAAYSRPQSRAEVYERDTYTYRPHSRQSYEDMYHAYPMPAPGGDYQAYYHMQPRPTLEEQDWKQMECYRQQGHYWDPGYYGAHKVEQENSHLPSREGALYRTNNYEESYVRTTEQERNGEDFKSNTQEDSGVLQNEFISPQAPSFAEHSLLQQYKESGLSSSSYELSQYMCDSSDLCPPEPLNPVTTEETSLSASPQSFTPLKYCLPHVAVCFGAVGQMVRVCPNYPTEGQPAIIEIHSLEVILHDTQEQEEMRAFLGPLIREDLHKGDILSFCQRKLELIKQLNAIRSRDTVLLWQLLVLLCRQNGSMVGSDIADLLMKDCKREKYKKQDTNGNLINLNDDSWPAPAADTQDLLTGEVPSCTETIKQAVEKFTKLLFYGRKKEALDWAMRSQLWGHALFLSSKMDLRTYSWVMSRFTSSLAHNDPLQTLFQLMSGRIPQACTCCGDSKWGDWRPHLAVILSNQVADADLTRRSILVMGDTLAMKGLTEASHFCYLVASVPFGFYSVKKDSLVLLGSNHSHSKTFKAFATTEAIQCTEILEYCRQLGQAGYYIPSFQVYKLIYASRLADYGLVSQAFHYCEGIAGAILAQEGGSVLLAELFKLADRLKFSDPCLEERPGLDPPWLVQLQIRWRHLQAECGFGDRTTGHLLIKDAPTEGCLDHKEPSHSHEHLQSDSRTQGDGHSQAADTYADHAAGTAICHLGTPYHPSEPWATEWQNSQVSGEGPVLSNSRKEARPGGYNEMKALPEKMAQDPSPAMYQPPGGAPLVGGIWESHARLAHGANAHVQQHMPVPRVRTVSECSTISVDEDATPPQNGGTTETTEQSHQTQDGNQELTENKKASGSGWFSWFRSKSTKEETVPSSKAVSTGDSTPVSHPNATAVQGVTPNLPPPPPTMSSVPPPPSALLSQSARNPFSRTAGNKPPSDGCDSRTFPLSPMEMRLDPAVSSGDLSPPGAGSVPLYNPSQVSSVVGSTQNHQPKLSQRRYPIQS
ncbi:protein transport protein Sec16B [Pleurodeles waltl]|uniref:protein transport protein Sec16B n=1 Tax=Pleurodeles waltl TaxID=8319 RepID=UPI0037095C1B